MGGAANDGYRLQALRTVREQEEQACKRALADAVAATGEAQAVVEARAAELERARAAEREAVQRADAHARGGAASVQDFVGARHYRERLLADIAARGAALAAAREALAEVAVREQRAREALAEAAREREAVERHYARWQAERDKLRERRQEAEADDLAHALRRKP